MSTTDNTAPDTEPTEDVQAPDNPGNDAGQTEAGVDNSAEDDGPDTGNREAAKWRKKLRDTEAERDALAERLTTADRNVIDYALGQAGIDPRLWELSGIDLDELRSDNGQLDITKALNAARGIRNEVYGTGPRPNPQQGNPSQASGGTLADVFRQR